MLIAQVEQMVQKELHPREVVPEEETMIALTLLTMLQIAKEMYTWMEVLQ